MIQRYMNGRAERTEQTKRLNGNGRTLAERLKRWYIDPQSLTPPAGGASSRTEILLSGRNLIEIDGCGGLTVYTKEQIALKIKEGILSIHGQDLELEIYRGKKLAVVGKIHSVLFKEDASDQKGDAYDR